MDPKHKKQVYEVEKSVVILGSGGCGKTCILHRLITNNFSDDYVPTVFENSVWRERVKDRDIVFLLKDTAGQEDYDRLISLAVSGTDIIIFCYSVDDRRSLEDIKNKYIHIIPYEDLKSAKVALIGNKTDLRSKGKGFVTKEEGELLGAEIGATWVFESSAKNNEGVREAFDTLARWSYNASFIRRKRGLLWRVFNSLTCGCCSSGADIVPGTKHS